MITGLQFKTGFPMKAPNVNNRIFEFTPGLNIIFGPNGSYKSVCLNTIKAYCGIPKGGWSRINDPSQLGTTSKGQFPFAYRAFTPGNCDAWVGWDGTPSFFNDGDIKVDATFFWDKERQSADGITTEAEQFDALATKPSSGQYRIQRINKIMQVIQTPPDLSRVPDHVYDKQKAAAEIEYLASLPRKGPMTLLFDEPERAIALPKAKELFEIFVTLSKSFQIIMATHSPFILFVKEANIIDMEPGYSDTCREIIKEAASKWKKKK